MPPEKMHLHVVTPEREVLSAPVEWIEMPGRDGYLGILPGHAPLITELGVGHLSFRDGKGTRVLTVIQGYAEVQPERVIVLAEVAERAEEIDVSRAERARDRARTLLARAGSPDLDWASAQMDWERAMTRLYVAAQKTGYIGGPGTGAGQ